MKGATYVSTDARLFERAAFAMQQKWPSTSRSEDVAQFRTDDGYLFNLFADDGGYDGDWRPDFVEYVDDLASLFSCTFECRSETVVAELSSAIASAVPKPVWLLDCNGVIWPADNVDAHRLWL